MAKPEYKITAKDAAEFEKLQNFVNGLPETLLSVVDRVEKGLVDIINVKCKKIGTIEMIVYLPGSYNEMRIHDGGTIIEAGNAIFTYPPHEGKYKIVPAIK